jgi:PAS domain S-box-containing protein
MVSGRWREGADRSFTERIVESVVDYGIIGLDPDGHVLTWNFGAERQAGYAAGEILGRHCSVLHDPDAVAAGMPDQELAIAAAADRYDAEGWRVRKDGTPYWADVVTTALRGPDGRLLGFGQIVREQTERKRGEDALRESEERFRLLVTAVSDYAIFLLNPDGTVASWNVGAERLKGYRADEIVGRHFSNFYTDEDRAAGVPGSGIERALVDGRWESEGWRLRKDGTRFWADVVITALFGADGRHRGFAKVTRDLTDRKRNEDALRGILEREREAAARLRELDRLKTDLVAIVAHDLRAPVGVIHDSLQLLGADWERMADSDKRSMLHRLAQRTAQLGTLVDDVLDLARIEAGELVVGAQPFDVAAVAERAAADTADPRDDRELTITVEGSPVAVGDERRTWQVLTNLLSNARKYSPSGTPLGIAIEDVGDAVVVTVVDHGPGIAAEHEALLFTRFGRLPSAAVTPGSGMGLFIARSLVEAQGGRLWLEPTSEPGATFRFTLPSPDGAA